MEQKLYLIATIDGSNVAIESDLVESVVQVNEVIHVPNVDPSVAGLFALRSRVLTLIDSQFLVTGNPIKVSSGSLAIVADISGHHYGLLVDNIKDVISVSEDSIEKFVKPSSKWSNISTGIVDIGGEVAMIINPETLVTLPMQNAA
jgi:purine-binding chemotaxis protein CheW